MSFHVTLFLQSPTIVLLILIVSFRMELKRERDEFDFSARSGSILDLVHKSCTNRSSDFFKLCFRDSICAGRNKKCLAHVLEDIADKCYFRYFSYRLKDF